MHVEGNYIPARANAQSHFFIFKSVPGVWGWDMPDEYSPGGHYPSDWMD